MQRNKGKRKRKRERERERERKVLGREWNERERGGEVSHAKGELMEDGSSLSVSISFSLSFFLPFHLSLPF